MLLERDDIFEELDLLATEVAAGMGRIVFIVGEAGIGKTSVLRAAAERFQDRLRPLWTACEDLSTPEALTLLRDLPIVDHAALDHADDSGSRLRLFADTLAHLAEVPTLLLVEDLHWADDGSIDFVRYVGRRMADLPLLLIVSARNEDQGARGRLVRAANDLSPTLRRRFDLARLSSAAVGALAAAKGLIGSAIHEATGGNPLLVTEMLATGGRRSASINDLIVGRADRLDSEARAFLDYCSIIPRRVSLEQIAAADATDAVIAACTESALLLVDGDCLAFRHEITRRAVEEALSPLRRALLHKRELERLDGIGASATRRLHHAIGADDRARIRDLAPQAAQQAASLGAHREAASAWSALLEHGMPPFDADQCAHYAFELHVTGDISGAIKWQNRALDIWGANGDRLREGDGLRFLSRLHYINGQRALADEAGHQAIPLLEAFPGSPELAMAYANLAQLAMLAGDRPEAVRWSERAIPIAEQLGRDDILGTLLNSYGTAIQYDEPDRWLGLLDRSIALGIKSESHEHAARAHTNKGWGLMVDRHLPEALEATRAGIDYCRERDLHTWGDYIRGTRALILLELGRWDEAEQCASCIADDRTNTLMMRSPAVRALALLRLRRGAPGWQELIDELRDHMKKGHEAPRFVSMVLIVAEAAWTQDEACDQALALLDEAAPLAEAYCGAWDGGAIWAWRRRLGYDATIPARIAVPYLRIAEGDMTGAASLFRDHAVPFDQALALVNGSEQDAAAGLAILDRLGATATATRVRSELAGRGIRRGVRGPRASTRSNSFGLTRREIDVLHALDKGWTNKEIGERLFVSAKTVDHHVSSILAKIDARTRGEAAAFARTHGLID